MRKGLYIITLMLPLWIVPTLAGSPGPPHFIIEKGMAINPYQSYWESVKWHETKDNCYQVNWEEMAFGPGQIRQCKLDDYNQANGTSYALWNCFSEKFSRRVFMWHCMQFPDIDTAIKRWNGSGPATEIYLANIKLLNYGIFQ